MDLVGQLMSGFGWVNGFRFFFATPNPTHTYLETQSLCLSLSAWLTKRYHGSNAPLHPLSHPPWIFIVQSHLIENELH